MSIAEARRLLDAARAGCDIPESQITEALCETGDMSWRVVVHDPASVLRHAFDSCPMREAA